MHERLDERVVNLLLHVNALDGAAALAGIVQSAVGERFRSAVERYDWTLEDRQLPERPARLDVGVVSLRLGRAAERRFIARRLAADLIKRAGELLDRARTDPISRTQCTRMRVRRGEVLPIS